MVTKRELAIAVLSAFCLTAALFMILPTKSSLSNSSYDPWVDYDSDGDVDSMDLFTLAAVYGSSGDPTKNVAVTNWPVSTPVTVWYDREVSQTRTPSSDRYNASGFCRLHLLAAAMGLGVGEELSVSIRGALWNEEHTTFDAVEAYSFTLTSTTSERDVTMFVPSEFYFQAEATSGDGYIRLSFYLTWA